jgi:quercetin dioxygenase-like cupin family protein
MVAQVTLQKGCVIKTHSHESEQIAVILSGRARFGLGDELSADRTEVELTGGNVLVLDSWLPHSVEILEDSVIMDIFSPPADRMGVDDQKE